MTNDNVVKLKQVHGGYVVADGLHAMDVQQKVMQGEIKKEGPEKNMTCQEVPVAAVEPPLPLGEEQNYKDAIPEEAVPTMTRTEAGELLHSFFQWVVRGPLLEQLVQLSNLQGARSRRAEDCVNCFLAANGMRRASLTSLEYVWPAWGSSGQYTETGRPKTTAERDLKLLCRTLSGKENQKQIPLAEMGLHVVATLIRKNSDYGASVFQTPMLVPNVNPEEAMLVRIGDKLQRIKNLRKNKNKSLVQSESLGDNYLDLAGYFILLATWWMVIKETTNAFENDAFEEECSQ